MRHPTLLFLFVISTGTLACGEDDARIPFGEKLALEPSACVGAWRSLHVLPQHPAFSIYDIGWLSDRFYFRRSSIDPPFAPILETISPQGETTATAMPSHYYLTTDGQSFASIGVEFAENLQELWTKPLDGTSWTLATSFSFSGLSERSFAAPFLVTADAIYGGVSTKEAYLVSRFDRTTGAEHRLAALRFPTYEPGKFTTFFDGEVTLWNDWLFFHSDAVSFSLPRAGGEPVYMSHAERNAFGPLGVASSGQVLWQGFESEDTAFLAVAQVGTIGPPTRLRTQLPKQFLANAALEDGRGGWVVVGSARLADGARHLVILSADAAGASRPIACDPEVDREAKDAVRAPHGIYLTPAGFGPKLDEIIFVPLP